MKDRNEEPYLIITANGYWGKGSTALIAAKNASVKSSWTQGTLYYASQNIVEGEIACAEMGGTEYTWNKELFDLFEKSPWLRSVTRESLKKGSGRMKVMKGKLLIETEYE